MSHPDESLPVEPEFKTIYEVYETVDMQGAKGGKKGTFTDYALANRAADGIGYYGTKGAILPVKAIIIGNKAYILKHNEPIILNEDDKALKEKIRQQALKKLSDAEKQALGIDG